MLASTKPFYPDDRSMDMTAYMGPRRAGKRRFNCEYGANPRDPKDGYPTFFTDEVFRIYKEAGLNFLMPEADAYFGENITEKGLAPEPDFEKSDLYQYMMLAKKHGLIVYPTSGNIFGAMTHEDGDFGEKEKEEFRLLISTLQEYFPETFGGIMLTDEPSYYSLGRIKKMVEYLKSDEIRKIKPDLNLYASMLPMYTYLSAYNPNYTDEKYNQTIKFDDERKEAYSYYIDLCADAMGEFCMDYYSLGRDGWLSPAFYQNMELMAQHAKRGGYPTSITLLSNRMDTQYNPKTGRGKTAYRTPSYEDMRFQVYSALAFGVQRIGYYTFWQHYSESNAEMYPKAMINYEPSEECGYRKTEIYYSVKEINEEVHSIDHIFMRYKWQGCKVVRTSRDRNIRLVEGGYEDSCLKDMKASRDLLVGCFENPEDSNKGYWVVNAQNPYRYEMNEVELTFEGATNLVYYRKGRECEEKLIDGKFRIRLGVGEGIFVIPYGGE